MDVRRALAALSEPTRFRIVELLDAGPRTVGEVAAQLGARQPATTKHLQALEAARVVTVHRLGRRRVVALQRGTLQALAGWLEERATQLPDESVLQLYHERIAAEEELQIDAPRRLRFRRTFLADRRRVWWAWTTEEAIRRWWAPEHFEVADCTVRPEVGGQLRVVLREGDGGEYVALGEFTAVEVPALLQFTLAPLDPDGEPLFTSGHAITLGEEPDGTTACAMTIEAGAIRPGAAAALAGVEIGWNQQLDRLAALLGALGE